MTGPLSFRRCGALVIAGVLVAGLLPAQASAAGPFAVQRMALYASLPNQQTDDHFGAAVAADGNVLVVGAPDDDASRGAIYISERVGSTWSDPVKVQAPGGLAGDEFGTSVDVSNGKVVAGAPYHDGAVADAGAAYVFVKTGSTWGLVGADHISQVPASANDHFGAAVAIDGDYIAVGCPGDDDKAADAGSVLVYYWTGSLWLLNSTQTCAIGAAGDRLGGSVDIDYVDATTLFVAAGAGGADHNAYLNCGAVTVFQKATSWSQDTLWAPDAALQEDAGFGTVAISGRYLVVGAPFRDIGGVLDVGEAYTYRKPLNLWQYEQTLTNPAPVIGDQYGWSVACEDNTVLIGAIWDDGYVGSVYPYTSWYGTTTAWPKITATGTGVAHFGSDVALSQGTILVGGRMSSSPDTSLCGAAYVFTSRGTVTGTVRDAVGGFLLPGKEVYALPVGAAEGDWQAPFMAVVDGSGNYSLSVDAGTYIILVQDPDGQYYQSFYNGADMYSQGTPVTVGPNGTVPGINFSLDRIGAVYRFYNAKNGTHFYTDSRAEVRHVKATWPDVFQYEGLAYVTDSVADTQPLYRFYNKVSQSHFYTASAGERDHVIATWPHIYTYEGPTYKVSASSGPWKAPIYRFYHLGNGSHFYTASLAERDHVIATWPNVYRYEGPAFWITQ